MYLSTLIRGSNGDFILTLKIQFFVIVVVVVIYFSDGLVQTRTSLKKDIVT